MYYIYLHTWENLHFWHLTYFGCGQSGNDSCTELRRSGLTWSGVFSTWALPNGTEVCTTTDDAEWSVKKVLQDWLRKHILCNYQLGNTSKLSFINDNQPEYLTESEALHLADTCYMLHNTCCTVITQLLSNNTSNYSMCFSTIITLQWLPIMCNLY